MDGKSWGSPFTPATPVDAPDVEGENLQTYTGQCHCGAVQFAFKSAPIEEVPVADCDCSYCSRVSRFLPLHFSPLSLFHIHVDSQTIRKGGYRGRNKYTNTHTDRPAPRLHPPPLHHLVRSLQRHHLHRRRQRQSQSPLLQHLWRVLGRRHARSPDSRGAEAVHPR